MSVMSGPILHLAYRGGATRPPSPVQCSLEDAQMRNITRDHLRSEISFSRT